MVCTCCARAYCHLVFAETIRACVLALNESCSVFLLPFGTRRMFRQQFTKLDAFGIQDCGLTGDSCGQPLFSHKPSYWFKSKFTCPCTPYSDCISKCTSPCTPNRDIWAAKLVVGCEILWLHPPSSLLTRFCLHPLLTLLLFTFVCSQALPVCLPTSRQHRATRCKHGHLVS